VSRAPGWLPDPTRRHELRYWDGGIWTADVADGGVESFDPGTVPVTPPPDDLVAPSPSDDRPVEPAAPPADPASDPASLLPGPSPLPPPPGRARRALPFVVALLVAAAGVAVVLLVVSGDPDDEDDPSTAASATGDESDGATSSSASTGDAGSADAMVDSIVTGIVEQTGGVITEDEAECMAEAMLDEVGTERLEEVADAAGAGEDTNPLGLLTEEEQSAALSRMRTCVDLTKLGELAPEGE
jgi:hypothetical protein